MVNVHHMSRSCCLVHVKQKKVTLEPQCSFIQRFVQSECFVTDVLVSLLASCGSIFFLYLSYLVWEYHSQVTTLEISYVSMVTMGINCYFEMPLNN